MKQENSKRIISKGEIIDDDKWYMEWYMVLMDTPFHGAPGG